MKDWIIALLVSLVIFIISVLWNFLWTIIGLEGGLTYWCLSLPIFFMLGWYLDNIIDKFHKVGSDKFLIKDGNGDLVGKLDLCMEETTTQHLENILEKLS